MIFIRLCVDKPDSADLRSSTRDAHRAFLKNTTVKLIEHGPLFDADCKNKNGSFMMIEAESKDEILAFHEADPFTIAGLFGSVHVHVWERH